jgi:hypothetical protein
MDRVLCIVPWIIVVFRKESSSQWESRRRLMGHEVGRPVSEVNQALKYHVLLKVCNYVAFVVTYDSTTLELPLSTRIVING